MVLDRDIMSVAANGLIAEKAVRAVGWFCIIAIGTVLPRGKAHIWPIF